MQTPRKPTDGERRAIGEAERYVSLRSLVRRTNSYFLHAEWRS
jgi:hypothetical protein